MNQHLSNVQISEWIAGERPAETQRHLRECPACHAELAGFESGLSAFGHALRQWAVQQETHSNPQELSNVSWRWALGAAAILTVALLPAYWQGEAPISAVHDDDARLLENIDIHLSRTVPSSMEPLMTLMNLTMNLTQEGKDERE
jgi:hypothetical protein